VAAANQAILWFAAAAFQPKLFFMFTPNITDHHNHVDHACACCRGDWILSLAGNVITGTLTKQRYDA